MELINLTAYKFLPLTHLPELKKDLLDRCKGWGLQGTILISLEGINFSVAGEAQGIEAFRAHLDSLPGFTDLPYKRSTHSQKLFNRMLVKIKKEIITMGDPLIDPVKETGPRLSAEELKQWYDEGRKFVIIDTRNDYELAHGSFLGAVDLNLKTFREFPQKLASLPSEVREQPVVMFCTGGIRCEKATAAGLKLGFKQVYQLDGGILKYFEKCGAAHYRGACYVFDQRVALGGDLKKA